VLDKRPEQASIHLTDPEGWMGDDRGGAMG
jgi:hypothetical protein